MLAESGWGCPTWPKDLYGRGLTADYAGVVAEEFEKVRAVGPATGAGMSLVAPTILEHGSDELKKRMLRQILTGEQKWCQLFSEPGNGSDLAGLTTRAIRDGDEWVVNGQKVWTTNAHHADYGMLLARTDWDVPKHRGITYFALPMKQPGVEVRPLKQMNGYASFNEVFITDARIPHSNIVGEANSGWSVALTTLAHERGVSFARFARIPRGANGRTAKEAAEEAAEYAKTYVWYPQRAGRADLVIPQAKALSRNLDPIVRQKVAALWTLERASRWTQERARAARARGKPVGPEGSISKLVTSEIARVAASLHAEIAGAAGMLGGSDSLLNGIIGEIIVSVPGQSIAGGTDEIQKNIIGERVLGLPREPSVDVDIPFREVQTNLRP